MSVLYELLFGVATFKLNRPKVRNALNQDMIQELLSLLDRALMDGDVRVIVLRGAGGHFCAGGDVHEMSAALNEPLQDGQDDPLVGLNAAFGQLSYAFSNAPIPVVAGLEGAVMGGGFGLACAADIAIAAENTVFRLPETKLGVIPAQIAPFLVAKIGEANAKYLALTGQSLKASGALPMGLVQKVVPLDALQKSCEEIAEQICAGGPRATLATKALFQDLQRRCEAGKNGTSTSEEVTQAATLFAKHARSKEAQEGMAAFLEKRKPSWCVEEKIP